MPLAGRHPWYTAGMVAFIAILATGSTWGDLFSIATHDSEASHVLLAPAILLWLAWSRWRELQTLRPGATWPGPIIMVLGWAMSYVGFYHSIQAAWHLGAVLIVLGGLVSVLGTALLARRMLPLTLALLFLIPLPGTLRQSIAVPLQTIAAVLTQRIFQLVHGDVVRHGNVLSYLGTDVAVAEGCNGLRLIAPLLMVVYAVVFTRSMRGTLRLLFLATAPLVALVANVLRLVPTVWLYGRTDTALAADFHDWSGWFLAPLTLFVLLGIIHLLPRRLVLPSGAGVAPSPS